MALGPGTSALTPTLTAPPRMPARVATVRRQFDLRARRFREHDALPREIEPAAWSTGCSTYGCRPARAGRRLRCRRRHGRPFPRTTRRRRSWGSTCRKAMLRQRDSGMRDRLPRWLGGQSSLLVAADAGRLPMADESVDLVFSNLMLHWHPEPHTLFPGVEAGAAGRRTAALLVFRARHAEGTSGGLPQRAARHAGRCPSSTCTTSAT